MRDLLGSLFSALIVVIGLIGAVLIYNSVTNTNKSSQAFTDLTAMVGSVQSVYASHPTFTNLTPSVIIAGKLAPASMISGTQLMNPWRGIITVAANGSNAGLFDVTEPSVPSDACVKMATSLGGLGGLAINGTSVALPADPAVVTPLCSSDANSLVFTFGR